MSNAQTHNVRVRFAPSPTGFLHIGGARTALFNWLFARSRGGQFLLRIEDTDRERSEDRFTQDIMNSLEWLGFDWDEQPVFQSDRFDRYSKVIAGLLSSGAAYRCECTTEELDAIRRQCAANKLPFRYPGTCREKKITAENTAIRVRVPTSGQTEFCDLIRGPISFANKDIDDWVIARPSGAPTYNFSVVIDDSDQRITHVLRGDDHINNTPKQILLYRTLGLNVPEFAHLPMILAKDKTKLSKRHGAVSTLEYRDAGYVPEAVISFLVRLGWSHGDQEIFTVDELKQYFSLEHIGKAAAVFDPDKLKWVSGQVLAKVDTAYLCQYLDKYFETELAFVEPADRHRLSEGVAIIQSKVKNVLELIEQLKCLFDKDPLYEPIALQKQSDRGAFELISQLQPMLSASDFTSSDIEIRLKQFATDSGLSFADVARTVRFAVTGGKVSPELFDMLSVQGQQRVERRVENFKKAMSR